MAVDLQSANSHISNARYIFIRQGKQQQQIISFYIFLFMTVHLYEGVSMGKISQYLVCYSLILFKTNENFTLPQIIANTKPRRTGLNYGL